MAKGKSGIIKGGGVTTPVAPGGIKSASDAKTFGQLQKHAEDKLGLKVGYTLHEADLESVKDAVSAIEAIIEELPQAKGSIKWISGNQKKSNSYASASLAGGIDLNGTKYKDPKTIAEKYANDVKNHFHPEGTTVKNITSHEAGHLLEKALINKKYGNTSSISAILAWNGNELSKGLISKACKEAKKTPGGKGKKNDELILQVSKYAFKNKSECLAECVADYMANGKNAKPLSVAVWAELKKELG